MNALRLLSFLACFNALGVAGAEALEITDKVHDAYQQYLNRIGHDRHGAFAVSADGTSAYLNVCTYSTCDQAKLGADAIANCASMSSMTCSLMVTDRLEKIPFTVVPELSEPSDDTRANILSEDKLKQSLVGNTLRGEYLNGLKWAEYLDPSGEIHGKDDIQGDYKARWTIVAGKMCFDYANFSDWCADISLQGDRLILLREEKVLNTIRSTTVHPGNAVGR
jgi:hypothetical protein